MRARHRHFNPQAAGATFGWDTRYNADAHTNNGAVGTWTDRLRNTATQSQTSPDRRPVWKDNSTDNINGAPVVVFDGSNDKLDTSSITTQTALSFVSIAKRPWETAKYANIFGGGTYGAFTGYSALTTGGVANGWQNKDFLFAADGFGNARNGRAIGTYGAIGSGSAQIISGVVSSSVARVWFNGNLISTRSEATVTVPSRTAIFQVGGTTVTGQGDDAGDFSIGNLQFWGSTELTSSLRKRLEHHAAYSFKIACN